MRPSADWLSAHHCCSPPLPAGSRPIWAGANRCIPAVGLYPLITSPCLQAVAFPSNTRTFRVASRFLQTADPAVCIGALCTVLSSPFHRRQQHLILTHHTQTPTVADREAAVFIAHHHHGRVRGYLIISSDAINRLNIFSISASVAKHLCLGCRAS